jgi:hypothetical protein
MKNLKALMVHVLTSKSFNIFFNELEISLVGFDRITEIILVNNFFVVSQEGSNGFDARCALKILRSK